MIKCDLDKYKDDNIYHLNINDNNGAFVYSLYYALNKKHNYVQCIYDPKFKKSLNSAEKKLYDNNNTMYYFMEDKSIVSINEFIKNNNKYIIFINIFFNKVILCNPVIKEPLKNNIMCVCKKYKYNNTDKILKYLKNGINYTRQKKYYCLDTIF